MYECFSLVLMVTHACNMRCSYCYAGCKSTDVLQRNFGFKAVDRALHSIQNGGTLELGFFGGEPLLQPILMIELLEYAQSGCRERGLNLNPHLTTNGTQTGEVTWRVMNWPGLQISVSHDGLPENHDQHRRFANGNPTSSVVLDTIDRMIEVGLDVSVVMVVRPDNVAELAEGILFFEDRGVRHFSPTLDLWTSWNQDDLHALEISLERCAGVWIEGLPDCSISWFDEKAARIAGVSNTLTARCGFGDGEIAVSPAGNLYPCERLIGDDREDNPFRLPGNVMGGEEFSPYPSPSRNVDECNTCAIQDQCSTICRCSNYVRTGDVRRPDGLLCLLDRVCYREASRLFEGKQPISVKSTSQPT